MSERITAVLDQIEAEAEAAAPDGRTALELLQAIYRDKRNPLHMRMRAASTAIPFETPKLAVTTQLNAGDLGDLLDRAINRSLNGPPKLINGTLVQTTPKAEDDEG
jgi:hypothetical protein